MSQARNPIKQKPSPIRPPTPPTPVKIVKTITSPPSRSIKVVTSPGHSLSDSDNEETEKKLTPTLHIQKPKPSSTEQRKPIEKQSDPRRKKPSSSKDTHERKSTLESSHLKRPMEDHEATRESSRGGSNHSTDRSESHDSYKKHSHHSDQYKRSGATDHSDSRRKHATPADHYYNDDYRKHERSSERSVASSVDSRRRSGRSPDRSDAAEPYKRHSVEHPDELKRGASRSTEEKKYLYHASSSKDRKERGDEWSHRRSLPNERGGAYDFSREEYDYKPKRREDERSKDTRERDPRDARDWHSKDRDYPSRDAKEGKEPYSSRKDKYYYEKDYYKEKDYKYAVKDKDKDYYYSREHDKRKHRDKIDSKDYRKDLYDQDKRMERDLRRDRSRSGARSSRESSRDHKREKIVPKTRTREKSEIEEEPRKEKEEKQEPQIDVIDSDTVNVSSVEKPSGESLSGDEQSVTSKRSVYSDISEDELKSDSGMPQTEHEAAIDKLDIEWSNLSEPLPRSGSAQGRSIMEVIYKIGLSKRFVGEKLFNDIDSKCTEKLGKHLLSGDAWMHASFVRKDMERERLLKDMGGYCRALTARRDLAIRRHLCEYSPPAQLVVDQHSYKQAVQLFMSDN